MYAICCEYLWMSILMPWMVPSEPTWSLGRLRVVVSRARLLLGCRWDDLTGDPTACRDSSALSEFLPGLQGDGEGNTRNNQERHVIGSTMGVQKATWSHLVEQTWVFWRSPSSWSLSQKCPNQEFELVASVPMTPNQKHLCRSWKAWSKAVGSAERSTFAFSHAMNPLSMSQELRRGSLSKLKPSSLRQKYEI